MLEQAEVKRWQRLTDAMLKHAAADDPEAFAQVVAVIERAQAKLPAVAVTLTQGVGIWTHAGPTRFSWAQLAAALGVTRSAAWQRFGPPRVMVGLDD